MGFWATKLSSKIIAIGVTVGQTPATWDRTHTHTQITTNNCTKENVCQSRLSGNGHTRQLQPIIHTMAQQISGLICRYMTKSNRNQHKKQTHSLTVCYKNEEIGPLSGASILEWRRIRERRAQRCRLTDDATRRRPTSRLADPRSGERPLG